MSSPTEWSNTGPEDAGGPRGEDWPGTQQTVRGLSNCAQIKHHQSEPKQRDQTVRSVRENQQENK